MGRVEEQIKGEGTLWAVSLPQCHFFQKEWENPDCASLAFSV